MNYPFKVDVFLVGLTQFLLIVSLAHRCDGKEVVWLSFATQGKQHRTDCIQQVEKEDGHQDRGGNPVHFCSAWVQGCSDMRPLALRWTEAQDVFCGLGIKQFSPGIDDRIGEKKSLNLKDGPELVYYRNLTWASTQPPSSAFPVQRCNLMLNHPSIMHLWRNELTIHNCFPKP